MSTQFESRLGENVSVSRVVEGAINDFGLSEIVDSQLIQAGYEDYNLHLQLAGGDEVLLKIFNKTKSSDDVSRLIKILEAVEKEGVNHPKLRRTRAGEAKHTDEPSGLMMAIFDFVKGRTFYDLGRIPDNDELEAIVRQAVLVNNIEISPPYIYDSWAIPNIHDMYNRVKSHLSSEDIKLVSRALSAYDSIQTESLPRCFVHGDLINTNVIKGDDRQVWIIDFSVANTYPRIQELAVMAGSLTDRDKTLADRVDYLAELYKKSGGKLANSEFSALYPYTLSALAMEFMGANQEKYVNNNPGEETEHWLELGRTGLVKALLKG